MTPEKRRSILIVDDEGTIRRLLARALSVKGYQCREAANVEQAVELLSANNIDLVILDIMMPGKSGIEFLPELKAGYPDTAVIMATATADINTAIQCMKQGAFDYIVKPFNLDEVYISVDRTLVMKRLELENRAYQQQLEERVEEQAGKIRASFLNSIRALAFALEASDDYTSGHSQRVSNIASSIARKLGLPGEYIDRIVLAGLVHDIGKIGIRDSILNKPGKLTADEWEDVQKHPEIGERILSPIAGDEELLKFIRHHHDRFDGTGYPDALKGFQIPMGARILAVADAYEAMTSERPYRKPLTTEQARAEIERGKGTQFDPSVVDAFLRSDIIQPRS